MSRKNILLIAFLALQAVLVAVLYRPVAEQTLVTEKFFTKVIPAEATSITITDDQKKVVTLNKGEKGWTVGEAGYPADEPKISALIERLGAIQTSRPVAKNKASHGRLKVGEELYARLITLASKGGDKESVFLGSSPSQKSIHARKDGHDEVYLVQDLSSYELMADNDSWWQRKYLDLVDSDLVEVGVKNAGGGFTLVRQDGGGWKMAGGQEPLVEKAVKEFLDKAGHISLTKYEGQEEKKEYGLDAPTATLTLKTKDKTYTVKIGTQDEKSKDHVIKSDHSPFYVRVSTYVVEHLLSKKADDFIAKAQPAATPPPGAMDFGGQPPPGLPPGFVMPSMPPPEPEQERPGQ